LVKAQQLKAIKEIGKKHRHFLLMLSISSMCPMNISKIFHHESQKKCPLMADGEVKKLGA
jgi:hypothetical protein